MGELRVLVLGGGSWGTTVAHLAAHNAPTTIWARDEGTVDAVNEGHHNPRYLAGFDLHPSLTATTNLAGAVAQADLLVMGVPTGAFRSTCEAVADHIRPWVPVISLAKGFEPGTHLRMTQVAEEVLPGRPVGVLSGPNLAKEILAGQPAGAVIAVGEHHIAERLQSVFATPTFRVFTHHDVVGCELGGALKNVYAIAAGAVEGMGLGDNARAAIITRGLAELIDLGSAMGGEALTLAGLAGMGDLLATCISPQSRNSSVGRQLGAGRPIADVLASMDQVAEGVKAAEVVRELSREHSVAMPIADQVYAICWEGQTPDFAQESLLRGRLGHERG
jgi:glycerol-3-phosphate dehydrogenase (NAD(P)+)